MLCAGWTLWGAERQMIRRGKGIDLVLAGTAGRVSLRRLGALPAIGTNARLLGPRDNGTFVKGISIPKYAPWGRDCFGVCRSGLENCLRRLFGGGDKLSAENWQQDTYNP